MKKINTGERSLIQRHIHRDNQGGFERKLWELIEVADSTNLDRLAEGFPEHVAAYRAYSNTSGWWHELLARADAEYRASKTLLIPMKWGGVLKVHN